MFKKNVFIFRLSNSYEIPYYGITTNYKTLYNKLRREYNKNKDSSGKKPLYFQLFEEDYDNVYLTISTRCYEEDAPKILQEYIENNLCINNNPTD